MNIPQGYKQTELGIIPEDWEVKAIGSLGYTYSGLSGKKKSDFGSGNAKYIPFLNILTNTQIDTNNLESVCVSSSEHQNSVSKGDLFFNTSSETPEEVGMCAVLSKDCLNTYLNSFCFGFRPFEDCLVDGVYLSYFFRGSEGRKLMSILAQGATRYNLSKTNLLESYIYIPPIAEQRAIAEALSDVDGLIAALDKKIAKKRLIKQGAMQQLLTGKKRLHGFTDEWIKCELLTVCNVLDNKRVPLNDEQRTSGIYPYCGANGIVDYIDRYIFDEDLILIAEDGGNFDQYETRPIAYWMSGKYWVNNHAHVLKAKNEYNQRYIFYQLEHKDITDYIVGGTRTKLTRAQLDKMEISMPSTYAEQQAIATILSDMDKEIADLEAQRDKYRLLKSGMMQKLLTGQVRLK